MNFRNLLASLMFLLLINACHTNKGCRDQSALNYDPTADKDCNGCCTYKKTPSPVITTPATPQGNVLLWTNDTYLINNCLNVTITISNGSTTKITGSFGTAPTTCSSTNGGYLALPPGDYTYTVTTTNCSHPSGSFSVTANGCTILQI